MQCSRCQAENKDDRRFCASCGAALVVVCAACHSPTSRRRRSAAGVARSSPARRPAPTDRLRIAQGLHAGAPRRAHPRRPSRARGRAQAGHGPVRGPQGLDGAPRRARSRGSAPDPRSRARAHDGRGPPLPGHGQPGHGRRHHGAVRRAGGARGPRRPRRLRRPAHGGVDRRARRRAGAAARVPRPDPRRAQLRRGGRARHRKRPSHGLQRGGADHAPRRAHGAARRPRLHLRHRGLHAPYRGLLCTSSRSGSSPSRGCPSRVDVFELWAPSPRAARFQAAASRGLTRFVGRADELKLLLEAPRSRGGARRARWWRSSASRGWGSRASSTSSCARPRAARLARARDRLGLVRPEDRVDAHRATCCERYFQIDDRADPRRHPGAGVRAPRRPRRVPGRRAPRRALAARRARWTIRRGRR